MKKTFPSGVPVRSLGDADQGYPGNAEIVEDFPYYRQLAGTAVDENDVGPGGDLGLVVVSCVCVVSGVAICGSLVFQTCFGGFQFPGVFLIGLDQAGKAAGENFAHHAVVVARRERFLGFDVELCGSAPSRSLRAPATIMAPTGLRALDVAVVVDLNAASADESSPKLARQGLRAIARSGRTGLGQALPC